MCARHMRAPSRSMRVSATSAGAPIPPMPASAARSSRAITSISCCNGRAERALPALPRDQPLTVYPAIDLKGGACVRLRQGEMDQATVYATDPGAQAEAWQDAGATWLHVVDLDGAFAGRSRNGDAVATILGVAKVPVQLGGGIRDMVGIEAWLAAGIRRVILGSIAARDPELV